ncbi:MAG: LysR family transcriptional regulator [Magnetococcus sp. WYHC-3]
MNMQQLRYVEAVGRYRHFGRAAENCHVTQPTLSIAVRNLEEELGIRLFERRPGEVRATLAGERILPRVRQILQQVESLRELGQQSADALSGMLRLGLVDGVGGFLLPRALPRLRRQAPGLSLFLEQDTAPCLLDQLHRGALDVILTPEEIRDASLCHRHLYDEPLVAVCPAGHPWSGRGDLRRGDVVRERLILPRQEQCLHHHVLRWLQEEFPGYPDAPVLEGGGVESILFMVQSGTGVSLLPCSLVPRSAVALGLMDVVPLAAPAPSRRLGMVWPVAGSRTVAVDLLAETLLATLEGCVRPLH